MSGTNLAFIGIDYNVVSYFTVCLEIEFKFQILVFFVVKTNKIIVKQEQLIVN